LEISTVAISETNAARNLHCDETRQRSALDELVERGSGGLIYVTASLSTVSRRIQSATLQQLRVLYPKALFVSSRELYSSAEDWRRRSQVELKRYAAAIIVTAATWGGDPYSGPTGEHVIGSGVWSELRSCQSSEKPILWQALEFPASYLISQFHIELLSMMTGARMAMLRPDDAAKPFAPMIGVPFAITPPTQGGAS
jgi:hypothetical protein